MGTHKVYCYIDTLTASIEVLTRGGLMMKRIGIMLLIIMVTAGICFAGGQEEEQPIKIGAIFAVTGGASFLGAPEAKTIEMLVEEVNKNGGVLGREVEVIIKDSAANPEKAISFAKQLIEEDQVLAILGPSTSGETLQIKELCEKAETLLISCAAAEQIVDPVASWVFKVPQKDSYAAQKIYATMNDLGISKVGVVAANTGFGNGGRAQLEKYAADFGIDILLSESYDRAATDLTAVLTKLKGAGVEAVINWSIVPAQSIIAKNMKQLGMDIPLFQSHGFANIKYVEAAGSAAEGIIFPAGRLVIAEELPGDHPQKDVLMEYKENYETRYDEDVSAFGGHAYDAFLVLIEAIKKAGTTEKEAVRTALETLSNVPGTAGVFNFTPQDHNGLGIDSFAMITVENGEFVPY
jgi:branched-chain amino acid transport system substrate-binding protein